LVQLSEEKALIFSLKGIKRIIVSDFWSHDLLLQFIEQVFLCLCDKYLENALPSPVLLSEIIDVIVSVHSIKNKKFE
jgi:hypothetical protein